MKLEGKNPIRERIASGKPFDKIYVQDKISDSEIRNWVQIAKQNHTKIEWVDSKTLDKLSETGHHQGIIAECTDFEYSDLDEISSREGDLLLVLLDGLQDPHNLGSVIRVAECVGANAVVIPARHSVVVNETVIRVSAGATAHVPVCKVGNLNSAIEKLKEKNIWVYAADMDGQSMYKTDLTGRTAIVIGAEGAGVSRLTKETCDGVVSIPMRGKVNSLNASVSAGILLYESLRQRSK
ncbi:MAG: 23S rRNA (guanosine(2251)-2'-O)-methyltransferase RlmB [Clostridia bacterium]|nr:23S rRNA (guanosine(2251)-2'-O)-methyltransferase RlmB [Clostridia bacterium]